MDCFDCIFIFTDDLAYLTPMYSLVSYFTISSSTCFKKMKSIKNTNVSKEWAKVLSFVWEKVLPYTEVQFSY